jgi:hypothetical protein
MKLTPKERHQWQKLAGDCQLSALPSTHLAAQHPATLAPEQHLQSLRRRLAAASREATAVLAPKEPPAAAPPPPPVAEADGQGAADAPPDQSAMPNKEQP